MANVRHVACMEHRAEAQKLSGITAKQQDGLALGRVKGKICTGYKHTEESKQKSSKSNKAYWIAHPNEAIERGAKTRGDKHPNWKGVSTRLNTSIRQMTEHRQWMDDVKSRDGAKCVKCGSEINLESHHIVPLVVLISEHRIRNRDDARACLSLWDLENGVTLCAQCHCKVHDHSYTNPGEGRRHIVKIKKKRRSMSGDANPNWRGGKITKVCQRCGRNYDVKQCQSTKTKYCSRTCGSDD